MLRKMKNFLTCIKSCDIVRGLVTVLFLCAKSCDMRTEKAVNSANLQPSATYHIADEY